MENPSEDGDPDNYADRYTGTADNGGVHTNSGIANHWYYLLVTDIGLSAAQQIAFNGFTSLNSTADFLRCPRFHHHSRGFRNRRSCRRRLGSSWCY